MATSATRPTIAPSIGPSSIAASLVASPPSLRGPAALLGNANRAIAVLAIAAFAAQSMVRATDTLLPQISADFGTTIGAASIIVTAYGMTHGIALLVVGPIADRSWKYGLVAAASSLSALTAILCGLAPSLIALAVARVVCGAVAAWIIPVGLAFIGDVVEPGGRQEVLARYMGGQLLGQVFGQAAGGVIGDSLGWRGTFYVLASLFALSSAALVWEIVTNPCTRSRDEPPATRRSKFGMEFIAILSHAWARIVLFTAFVEGMLGFGVFGFVSADLHSRFGLGFTIIGLTIGAFSLGGIVYALTATFLVARLGQIGLSVTAAVCLSFTYVVLAVQTQWWLAPAAVAAMGFGFYMLHNTLVANATQVLPRARGSAMALFGASFFFGQTAGAAIFAFAFDRYGGPVIFLTAAILLPAAITWFAVNSKRKAASSQCQS